MSEFSDPSASETLVELLNRRVRLDGCNPAYTFLGQRGEEVTWSWADLESRVRRVGAALRGLRFGDRAILAYPPGLDFIAALFGCFAAGVIGVPVPADVRPRSLEHLRRVSEESGAAAWLTTDALAARLLAGEHQAVIVTDVLDGEPGKIVTDGVVSRDTIAFLQYTSGSTLAPRGVIVRHCNVLANERMIARAFAHERPLTVVGWLPHFHDMGLIGNILQPMYVGGHCVLMSPMEFLRKPLDWLRAISRFRAHTSGGPNFAYDACCDTVAAEGVSGIDLSCWKVAFNGSEQVRAATLDRFARMFSDTGFSVQSFVPCYGLAEATLFVSGGPASREPVTKYYRRSELARHRVVACGDTDNDARALVGTGHVAEGVTLEIVKPQSRTRCGPDEVGEIWVAGANISSGYWGRPEPRHELAGHENVPFLRTGDLGFVKDGELFISGRDQELIIVRGRNYYASDLVDVMSTSHPALRPGVGAAFQSEDESLVLVQAIRHAVKDLPYAEICLTIRNRIVEEFTIEPADVIIVPNSDVPRTRTGKIQHTLCRSRYQAGGLRVLARLSPRRDQAHNALLPKHSLAESPRAFLTYLCSLIAEYTRRTSEDVDATAPPVASGLDSLGAAQLAGRLEREYGVKLTIAELLGHSSVATIAADAAHGVGTNRSPQDAGTESTRDDNESFPLTQSQRHFWLSHRISPDVAHSICAAAEVDGRIDAAALERAAMRLIERHPMLRSTVYVHHGQTLQTTITSGLSRLVTVTQAAEWTDQQVANALEIEAVRPIDPAHGPMFRIMLLRRKRSDALMLTVAHIAADYWSMSVLVRELDRLYGKETVGREAARSEGWHDLPPFRQWAIDQEARWASPAAKERVEQFLAVSGLCGCGPLNLPFKRTLGPLRPVRAQRLRFEFTCEQTEALQTLAAKHRTTVYVVLLSAMQILLHRYTQQDSFATASPTWGRENGRFHGVIGCFTNTFVVAADVSGDPKVGELVDRTRQAVLISLSFADIPYALVAAGLRGKDSGPAIQVLFTVQDAPLPHEAALNAFAMGIPDVRLELEHLRLKSLSLDEQTSDFGIDVALGLVNGRFRGYLAYNSEIIEPEFAQRFANHFVALACALPPCDRQPLSTLQFQTQQESKELLLDYTRPDEFPEETPVLHQLLERQAAKHGHRLALVCPKGEFTYSQLNHLASRVAAAIREPGAPSGAVGLLTESGSDGVSGMFGALKAGYPFVPLSQEDPPERSAFILSDCGVRTLLASPSLLPMARALIPRCPGIARIVILDENEGRACEADVAAAAGVALRWLDAPESSIDDLGATSSDPDALAYILYTSGTSGQPKGVPISHQNLAPFFYWAARRFELGPNTRLIQTLSPTFDFGVQEILSALLFGGTLFAFRSAVIRDLHAYGEVVVRRRINTIFSTPSFFRTILEFRGDLASVELVLFGGESLTPSLCRETFERVSPRCRIFNGYGPTETSINCATFEVTREWLHTHAQSRTVPIGSVTGRARLRVLDQSMNPVPVGGVGELYIGGPGVARGYHDRPSLTAQRFIDDPFEAPSSSGTARLYRSGDLVRWVAPRVLEFLGRADRQIKLRGYRVELAEIEETLREHPGVSTVAAAVCGPAGRERLVAYVSGALDGQTLTLLRVHAQRRLPPHMVPWRIEAMGEIPLTPHGKIDLRALQRHAAALPLPLPAGDPPITPLERLVADVWKKVLCLDEVGANDSFLELGGHSLLFAELHAHLEAAVGRPISIAELYEERTVRGMATVLEAVPAVLDSASGASGTDLALLRQRRAMVGFRRQRGDARGQGT